MALVSGSPPVRLLDGGAPGTWDELDLEVLSQWQSLKDSKCPGCGRSLARHLHNSRLGREETVDDYTAWTLECPARQAIAEGQQMWNQDNKSAIDLHDKGKGPDPRDGVYWISQAEGESLPQPEK
jgi:hypothetical protein